MIADEGYCDQLRLHMPSCHLPFFPVSTAYWYQCQPLAASIRGPPCLDGMILFCDVPLNSFIDWLHRICNQW